MTDREYRQVTSDKLFETLDEDLALSATMEITHRCNFRCIHCYGASERVMSDMSLDQVLSILDQLRDHGTLDLSLTGGDPLMRRDFCEIYTYARKCGMFVSVLTNATLLTQKHIDVFLEYPVSQLSITMYGFSKEVYERMTGIAGSHTRFLQAIQLLNSNGIPFELKSVATSVNQQEMPMMQEFADQIGVPFRFSTKVIPENNGCRQPLDCALSPEEELWFDMNDQGKRKAWEYASTNQESYHEHRLARRAGHYRFLCHAGDKDIAISADGQLHLCLNFRDSGYDLLTGSVTEGYDKYVKVARDEIASGDYHCLVCPDIHYCDQCAAEIGLLGSFQYGKEPTCVVARLRHEWLEP